MLNNMTKGLQKKVDFVQEINAAITKVQPNVTSIEYKVFKNKEAEGAYDWYEEYLVINYNGGGKTARVCTGNSCSAILEEIARYLEHGYYSELQDLEKLEQDTEHWEPIDTKS